MTSSTHEIVLSVVVLVLFFYRTIVSGQVSCKDRCGNYNPSRICQCNSKCVSKTDCCEDFEETCDASCFGRCYSDFNRTETCHCNDLCLQNENCCPNFNATCIASKESPSESNHLGLIVGCVVGGVMIIVTGGLLCWRHKRRRRAFGSKAKNSYDYIDVDDTKLPSDTKIYSSLKGNSEYDVASTRRPVLDAEKSTTEKTCYDHISAKHTERFHCEPNYVNTYDTANVNKGRQLKVDNPYDHTINI